MGSSLVWQPLTGRKDSTTDTTWSRHCLTVVASARFFLTPARLFTDPFVGTGVWRRAPRNLPLTNRTHTIETKIAPRDPLGPPSGACCRARSGALYESRPPPCAALGTDGTVLEGEVGGLADRPLVWWVGVSTGAPLPEWRSHATPRHAALKNAADGPRPAASRHYALPRLQPHRPLPRRYVSMPPAAGGRWRGHRPQLLTIVWVARAPPGPHRVPCAGPPPSRSVWRGGAAVGNARGHPAPVARRPAP